MPTTIDLENRLEQIGQSLAQSGEALALLGLGSAGKQRSRMDEYSDLDFFAIVRNGYKHKYVEDLFWLARCYNISFAFRNTADGYKLLFEDGIFCEFAVFEHHELEHIPFESGQVIWAENGFDTKILEPKNMQGRYQRSDNPDWIIGEAVTNLYVGLCRYRRGEKLSGMKFVQSFALDRVIDLIHIQNQPSHEMADPYMPDRRLESRFEFTESLLSSFCQGYEKTAESALAQLNWLEAHFSVNQAIANEVRRLANS